VCPSVVSAVDSDTALDSLSSDLANAPILEQPMLEAQRQRQGRNRREQLRAQRLCEHIEALRNLLVASGIYCSPNKYAVLSHVAQYIAVLQSRALTIDDEQQRLQATIRSTTELLHGGGGITNADSTSLSSNDSDDGDDDDTTATALPESYSLCTDEVEPSEAVQYQDVVASCPFPIGLVSLDGHIVTSNNEFERLLNPQYPQASSLANQSLFVHVRNHGDVFHAMEDLLKQSVSPEFVAFDTETDPSQPPNRQPYWSGSLQTIGNNETVSTS
jgi:Helix-loop-helix DNA-binding domain